MNPEQAYESETIARVPALVHEAKEQRERLRQWRDQVRAGEQREEEKLRRFNESTQGEVTVEHPLLASLDGNTYTATDDLGGAVQELLSARDAIHLARAAQNAIASKAKELETKRSNLRTAGWIGVALGGLLCLITGSVWMWLIVFAGVYLLVKAARKKDATGLQSGLAMRQSEEAEAKATLEGAKTRGLTAFDAIKQAANGFIAAQFQANAESWRATWGDLPPFLRGDWSEEAWRAHDFKLTCRLPVLVTGFLREQPLEGTTPFQLPFFAPFLGQQSVVLLSGPTSQTMALLHGLILQLATALPYQATFTLLDPAGAGRAFPMQRSLPFVRRVGADLYRDLEQVIEDITRIIHTYLDDQTKSFEELPDQIQANERYEFVCAANFPDGYDRRTIETLQRIAKNGPIAGKYLFIQQSSEKALPKDLSWDDFGKVWCYDLAQPPKVDGVNGCVLEPLGCPQPGAQSKVLEFLALAKPPETKIAWENLPGNDPASWWREDAARLVSAPVGASGRARQLTIWFGANRDGRPCAHGILGAMTGSGKSNLYHVLICGLAIRYSPDELNLYLIDGKFGVEFAPYRRLPHARVVALHTAPELSRSVLEELLSEMRRRNDLFKKLGVSDLTGYRELSTPTASLPRVVLMIDEYQELFEDDRIGRASEALLQLAQQGRSAGIHMLLGSQRFGAQGMLHQTAIFGNIHLRMAMKMSQSDVQGLTEFGRNGKRLVEQCDLPGKIVINDQSGEDKANEFGKVALLEPLQRTEVINQLVEKAAREWLPERRFATVVFDGQAPPNFVENPQVANLLHAPERPTPTAFRQYAVKPAHQQGLGVTDWFAGERPLALWLGQELNVHGQARVILRRRPTENVLFVGDSLPAIYGMLESLLCSLPLNTTPDAVRVWLGDRAVPGTPWEGGLEVVVAGLLQPLGFAVEHTRDARRPMIWFDDWSAELDRRTALDEAAIAAEPAWLMLLAGADRLPALTRTQNKFGATVDTPDGEKLKRFYRDGPALGCHVVLTFAAAGPLRQVLDRAQLDQFKHRVVTQMSDEDSFLLLGNDHAAKLQRADSATTFAICRDTVGGTNMKFKPYVVNAQMPWPDQLAQISAQLQHWKEAVHVDG